MKSVVLAFLVVLVVSAVVGCGGRQSGVSPAPPAMEMVSVRGGCFAMGDTFGDGRPDQWPPHEVCVDDFSIGTYEVTQAQWQAVMGNNPSKFRGGSRPVERVAWNDVQKFIAKLNEQTGRRYRLPTEAEWEYAARSGGKEEKYAGTNDLSQLTNYAWYEGNSQRKTHAVGTKRPNGLGIYDMSGNVEEWVQDIYGDLWYRRSPRENPQGPAEGLYRVARGGSWCGDAKNVTVSFRVGDSAVNNLTYLGFRLALSPVK